MARIKPKFDKQKCLKCRWHGMGLGWSAIMPDGKNVSIHCNYSGYHDTTPLRSGANSTILDLRGEDYDNCLLYVEGMPDEEETEDKSYDDDTDLLR